MEQNIVVKKLSKLSREELASAYLQVLANHNTCLFPNDSVFIDLVRTIQLEESSSKETIRSFEDVIKDTEMAIFSEIAKRFFADIERTTKHASSGEGIPIYRVTNENDVVVHRLLSFSVALEDGTYSDYIGEAFGKFYFWDKEQAKAIANQTNENGV